MEQLWNIDKGIGYKSYHAAIEACHVHVKAQPFYKELHG